MGFLEQLIGSINQGTGRAMDYVTPGDQRRMYMSKQQVQQQDNQKKKKAYEQVLQTPLAQKQQPRINTMLDRGRSFEDISTQTGMGVNEIRSLVDYARPGYGVKSKTALEQGAEITGMIGKGIVDAATVLPRKVGTTFGMNSQDAQNAQRALQQNYKQGIISAEKLREEFDKLGMKDVIGEQLVQDDTGNFTVQKQNPLEFTKDFTNAGIDTAGTVVPFARGATVATNGQRLLNGSKLTQTGKQLMNEGNAWMGVTTAQSALNGQLTPEAIAMNAAASYGLPFAGAGTANVARATKKEITKAARKQEESIFRAAAQDKILTRVEPHYIKPSGKPLDGGIVSQKRADIINGKIEPLVVVENPDKTLSILDGEHNFQAYKELGVAQVPTRVVTMAEVRMMKQGGYLGMGKPDTSYQGVGSASGKATHSGKNLDAMSEQVGKLAKNSADNTEAISVINKAAKNPDADVTVYRATTGNSINDGDWVFLTKAEADRFTRTPMGTPKPGFKVVTQKATAKDIGWTGKNLEFMYSPKKPSRLAREGGYIGKDDKSSKRIQQAENDFIAGKIDGNRLEAVREADAKGMPLPKKVTPARNLDANQYIKDQTKAQKAAGKTGMGLKEKTSDFKEKFIDDLAPIEDRLNKAIKNGTSIDPKDHITYQLDRSRRAEGIMNAYVRDNGLDKIIQNVKNTNEFDQYLIARHSKELDESITTGRNAAKDAALVKQLDSTYGEQAKELYKYNQKLLDSSVKYGLISKETAASLKKQYPEYVPFNRIFNEDELSAISGGNGKGNASISKQTVVQKIKGSERAIASPLNSIIDKTRLVVEQGERNKAAQMLASYKDIEGNPFNLKELSPNETTGSRHTISYLDNGKKRVFETDKEISDAAKNMTREEIGMWGRIAAVPARVLRGGATTLNVGFAGANVVKDIVGAAINSRHPFRIADPEAMGKALSAALHHNGKYYQELMREGVTGTSFDMYRNPLKSNVGELRSHKNLATRTAYNVTHPGQWVRTLENTIGRSEDFGRALQYYSNKKGFKGENATLLAADQARSNSTNFFRHGSVGKNVNLAIPYWNAGVQGARIMTRRTKERPVQTIAKLGMVIAAPSAMIAMNNYGDEKKRAIMEDIQPHEKDGYIIIVGDDAKFNEKTGKYDGVTKIPVPPQHIGVHRAIQDAVRSAFTGEAMDHAKNIGRVVEDYTTINPTDPKAMASRYIPQALKLVAEPMTNTNFFTGNKIVSDSQKNLPAADQYGDYTSGTAKVIGKLTNGSPKMIDNTIRTGLGGAGQNLVNMTDNLLAATGAISKDEVQGRTIADSIKGRFSGATAINPSDKAEKKLADFKKQVIATDEYKNASQYDKSRMLNRLETDIKAVEWDKAPAKDGQEKDKLTKKQQTLATDGFKADTYTDLSEKKGSSTEVAPTLAKNYKDTLKEFDGLSDDEKEKKFYAEPDAEFRIAAAKYENEKANGTLTPAKRIEAEDKMVTLQVGSKFPKDVRDLYGLTKTQLTTLINNGELKESQAEQILAMDDAMVAAGKKRQWRDKNGNVAFAPKGRGGGRGGRKGTGKGKGGTGSKRQLPSDSSTIALVSSLSRKVANTKVAKRQLPKNGGISAPGIKAYKKVAKTNVSMTRKA